MRELAEKEEAANVEKRNKLANKIETQRKLLDKWKKLEASPAQYYSGAYQAAPGTHIRISGHFAHARYTSFQVYDFAQRPLDVLADLQLAPDAGSFNPFLPGASRTVAKRDYTAFIDFGSVPSTAMVKAFLKKRSCSVAEAFSKDTIPSLRALWAICTMFLGVFWR